ncbi:unnamed protein product [Arctogadus glacialis]
MTWWRDKAMTIEPPFSLLSRGMDSTVCQRGFRSAWNAFNGLAERCITATVGHSLETGEALVHTLVSTDRGRHLKGKGLHSPVQPLTVRPGSDAQSTGMWLGPAPRKKEALSSCWSASHSVPWSVQNHPTPS